jgi:hypothetical protein
LRKKGKGARAYLVLIDYIVPILALLLAINYFSGKASLRIIPIRGDSRPEYSFERAKQFYEANGLKVPKAIEGYATSESKQL